MTSNLKSLLGQVQGAVDEAVAESARMGNLVAEMKRTGYDLCLVLESIVTITPTDVLHCDAVPESTLASHGLPSPGDLKLTDADRTFLQELKISAGRT
jgi:hypothetical protein